MHIVPRQSLAVNNALFSGWVSLHLLYMLCTVYKQILHLSAVWRLTNTIILQTASDEQISHFSHSKSE